MSERKTLSKAPKGSFLPRGEGGAELGICISSSLSTAVSYTASFNEKEFSKSRSSREKERFSPLSFSVTVSSFLFFSLSSRREVCSSLFFSVLLFIFIKGNDFVMLKSLHVMLGVMLKSFPVMLSVTASSLRAKRITSLLRQQKHH